MKTNFPFDINCDLGEEKNVEEAIMPLIQSANIACGAHAGNEKLIRNCIRLAHVHEVKIGVHPSFPDRANFGRVVMNLSKKELIFSLKKQIDVFIKIAEDEQLKINHIKLHGALYNLAAKNEKIAISIFELLEDYPEDWIVFCPPKSKMEEIGLSKNRTIWSEAFLDRTYESDGSLRSRKFADAIIQDSDSVVKQLSLLIRQQKVKTVDEQLIELHAQTFCIHGDHENSVAILKHIKSEWENGRL